MNVDWRAGVLAASAFASGYLGAAFLLLPLLVLCPLALVSPDAVRALRAWADLWQGLYLAQFPPLIGPPRAFCAGPRLTPLCAQSGSLARSCL